MEMTRDTDNKILGGVCAGLARYFNADVSLVRILVVLVAVLAHIVPVAIAYMVACMIVPEKGSLDEVSVHDQR